MEKSVGSLAVRVLNVLLIAHAGNTVLDTCPNGCAVRACIGWYCPGAWSITHTYMHARTRARTHARMHARTHETKFIVTLVHHIQAKQTKRQKEVTRSDKNMYMYMHTIGKEQETQLARTPKNYLLKNYLPKNGWPGNLGVDHDIPGENFSKYQ